MIFDISQVLDIGEWTGAKKNLVFKDDETEGTSIEGIRTLLNDRKFAAAATLIRKQALIAEKVCMPSYKKMLVAAELFGRHFSLSKNECHILSVCALIRECDPIEAMIGTMGPLAFPDTCKIFNLFTGIPLNVVSNILGKSSRLRTCGILSPYYYAQSTLDFVKANYWVAEAILRGNPQNFDALMQGVAPPGPKPKLGIQDFEHVSADVKTIVSLLKKHKKGQPLNILLYGPPGTGKTELARLLCSEAGLTLNEIISEHKDRDIPMQPEWRLESFVLSQNMLRRTRNRAVLFDEIEDVFSGENVRHRKMPSYSKSWMNTMLETTAVPVIWVTNSHEPIDPAHMRRFQFILHVGSPPPHIKEKLITRLTDGFDLPSTVVKACAEHRHIQPALIERACEISMRSSKAERGKVFTMAINNYLKATGARRIDEDGRASSYKLQNTYDPSCTNIDADLPMIIDSVKNGRPARILFYGAPGTGKTALAHHLAEVGGMKMLEARCSDIQSKYVGDTEKHIRAFFETAEKEKAAILLDEADSLLQSRRQAQPSWETSQVNEMLVCLERYPGLVMASTNLRDNIDVAASRRFDFKIHFKPLLPDQSARLLSLLAEEHGLVAVDLLEAKEALQQVEGLVPGDFAIVSRKLRFISAPIDAQTVIDWLKQEVKDRQSLLPQSRPIGFTAPV